MRCITAVWRSPTSEAGYFPQQEGDPEDPRPPETEGTPQLPVGKRVIDCRLVVLVRGQMARSDIMILIIFYISLHTGGKIGERGCTRCAPVAASHHLHAHTTTKDAHCRPRCAGACDLLTPLRPVPEADKGNESSEEPQYFWAIVWAHMRRRCRRRNETNITHAISSQSHGTPT